LIANESRASARIQIDKLLTQCGWTVQDYTSLDLSASRGVALREVPLKNGRCDLEAALEQFAEIVAVKVLY